jgi:DNA-binding CsgD family transcriptional regulator
MENQCHNHGGHLTKREINVLVLIAAGLGDAEVAEELHVSRGTVETHIKHMRIKAGTHSRVGLVALAYAAGVLLPGNIPPR